MLGNNNVKKVVVTTEGNGEKALPWQRTYSMKPSIAKNDRRVVTLVRASDKLFGSKTAERSLNEGNNTKVIENIENFTLEVAGAFLVGDLVENLLAKVQQYQVLLADEVALDKEKDEDKIRVFKQGLEQATTDLKKQAKEITEFLAKK